MKVAVRTRYIALAIAAGTLITAPLAMPASAAALKPSVTCAKESSPPVKGGTSKSTFATCTPVALKAGGTGVTLKTPPAGSQKGQIGLKITWNGGKGTTTMAIAFAVQTKPGKCKAGTTHITATGKVTAATGAAATITKTGEPVTASTCVITKGATSGQSSLEPGTTFKL